MSTLSKKTKGQLVEIAEDLSIDISDCKVKKEVYEVVKSYFINNADSFDTNSKYYELATLSKMGSPKKTVFVEGDDGDVKEVDIIEEEENETEQAPDSEETDGESSSDTQGGNEGVQDDKEKDVPGYKDEEDDDDDDDDDDLDFECFTNFFKALQHGTLPDYIELKNYEIRDYLGDPYSINEVAFYIESLILLYSLSQFTHLGVYLPSSVSSILPKFINNIPVLSVDSFTCENIVTVSLWYLFAKALPLFFSYYINFTYDFDRDAFTEALAKLFFAIIVFKADVPTTIKDEIKYAFTYDSISVSTFKHFAYVATANLRYIFGNWVLIDALFTSILALYANLAFV